MRPCISFLSIALVSALLSPLPAIAQSGDRCTALYDANGARIGGATQAGDLTTLSINQGGVAVRLRATYSELRGERSVYFAAPNCQGDPYMEADNAQPEANKEPDHAEVWYPDTFATPILITKASQLRPWGECTAAAGTTLQYPAFSLTLPAYTTPYRIEYEACYTPAPAVAALTPYGLGAMALVFAFGAYLMRRRSGVA